MNSWKWLLASTGLLLVGFAYSDSISAYYENDMYEQTDGYYTSGESLAYRSDNDWGLRLAQQIYTPSNKDNPLPEYYDRPYAGWLKLDYYKNVYRANNAIDTYGIGVGMVGPWSLAEAAQTFVHSSLKQHIPQGWQYQLHNEPTLQLVYFRTYSIFLNDWVEYRPSAGINLGNARTDAELSNTIRAGYNIPKRFDPVIHLTASRYSDTKSFKDSFYAYFFATVTGMGVARDMFLDGNTFTHDTVTVDKRSMVAEFDLGISIGLKWVDVTVTHVARSQEFTTQTRPNVFDSIQVSYNF